jgi:hypothetical protein
MIGAAKRAANRCVTSFLTYESSTARGGHERSARIRARVGFAMSGDAGAR